MYAIIDIETTGLSAKSEKITEVAIILHDGIKETARYSSLVNPERKVPYRITQITGINDQMVATAPKFYEIAKKIIELTEGRTIIGHNVTFDYNFLKSEFAEFGYDYQRPTLCTVKSARKVFPGQPSYSLGNITKTLNINHFNKHRAIGDAEATMKLFELIIANEPDLLSLNNYKLPKALQEEKIKSLPDESGVYYFLNSKGNVIYVGKSKNIRQRIISHLNNFSNKKAVDMIDNIADLKYTLTGNELIALLFESEEIKRIKPIYNRAQIRSVFSYGIFMETTKTGFYSLKIGKNEALSLPLTAFASLHEAKDYLHFLADEFNLCHSFCGLNKGSGACFSYQVHKCDGACVGKETPESYNTKVIDATERMRFRHKDFFLIERGVSAEEFGVVCVSKGSYRGFGYIPKNKIDDINSLKNCILEKASNRDNNNIILSWMRNHSYEMIIG